MYYIIYVYVDDMGVGVATKTAKLRRNQLDRFFKERFFLRESKAPKYGWIHEIRQALGMSMQDLAERLGVIKQRVDRMEKDEVLGKLTLGSLQHAAEAMNCELVYFLVPRGEGLQTHLESQAHAAAREIVMKTERTMSLEDQSTSARAQSQLVEDLAQQLLLKEDRKIWRTVRESTKSSRRNTSR